MSGPRRPPLIWPAEAGIERDGLERGPVAKVGPRSRLWRPRAVVGGYSLEAAFTRRN